MTREEAARVLREMAALTRRNDCLWKPGESYVCAYPSSATLYGDFTADQLEAIATWMRDPTIAEIKP